MNCNDIGEKLSLMLDGALDEVGLQQVDDHLRQCPSCRQEFESLQQYRQMMARMPQLKAPADFLTGVKAGVDAHKAASWPVFFKQSFARSRKALTVGVSLLLCVIIFKGISTLTPHRSSFIPMETVMDSPKLDSDKTPPRKVVPPSAKMAAPLPQEQTLSEPAPQAQTSEAPADEARRMSAKVESTVQSAAPMKKTIDDPPSPVVTSEQAAPASAEATLSDEKSQPSSLQTTSRKAPEEASMPQRYLQARIHQENGTILRQHYSDSGELVSMVAQIPRAAYDQLLLDLARHPQYGLQLDISVLNNDDPTILLIRFISP